MVRAKRKFCIAIDLGGTNLRVGLLDARLRIVDRADFSTQALDTKDRLIATIVQAVNEIIARNRLTRPHIAGVGLGLPGPVDTERGIVHFFPNIPGWKEVRLRGVLERAVKLPVFLDNDANLMCLAEHRRGAARGARNAVCLTLGTGVGGGIIIDRALYRGSGYAAGEIGHIPLNERGPQCNCGGTACLEAYIGNRRIAAAARRRFKKSVPLEELSRRAAAGDPVSRKIWMTVGDQLGVALAGVVNLLNPDVVVIGGGVANAGAVLFSSVRRTLAGRAMSIPGRTVRVVKAALGNDAGLIGAALLVSEGAKG